MVLHVIWHELGHLLVKHKQQKFRNTTNSRPMDNPKIGHIELDFEVKRETDMGLCNVELRALYIKPRKK